MPLKYQYKGEKNTELILVKNSNCAEEKIDSLKKWFFKSLRGNDKSQWLR